MECILKSLIYLYGKCLKSYKERKIEEDNHFLNIQTGLKNSMDNIEKALIDTKNWEELMNIKEEYPEENKLMRNKIIKPELKTKKNRFDFIGLIFCLFHLIGVQEGIIILNSLFSEIVDEFKLLINKTPRKYNFYEKIEILSYRDLPEIDVGMVTSSIGIVVLKEIGFIATNSIFQLISLALYALVFFLFKFHTYDKLLKNYNAIEIFVLIISYVLLSILVGCTSTLALKEYFKLFYKVYNKEDKGKWGIYMDKIIFYILSGISCAAMILINRLIFTSFKEKASKW